MATRQIAPVVCPTCGERFTAPIESIIDVGRDPSLKTRFLQGRLNIAQCPRCGSQGAMTAPLLYHDPAHEMALVLMPQDLQLHNNDQQKLIGDLTNSLLNSLPPEQRKGYLLNPKIFLTMQSLVNAVLQAEGITPEMVERQQAKVQLIDQLLRAPDEESLRKLVKEHDAELDYEFFQVLTAWAQTAHSDGRADVAQALLGLRSLLAEWSSGGRAALAQVDASLGLGESITREELLARLQDAQSDEEFEELIAAGRSLLDYAFFQGLTAQMEAAGDPESTARLKALRSRILDTTARQDEEARTAVKHAADLLSAMLKAEDPQTFARQHLDEIDDSFFTILSANIQRAEAEKRDNVSQALHQIGDMVMALLEEQLPPEIRLLNRLLSAPDPDSARQLLESERSAVTPQFVATLGQIIAKLEADGNADAAAQMKQIKSQAEVMAQGILQP
jgi:hypothetical protein